VRAIENYHRPREGRAPNLRTRLKQDE